MPSPEEMHITKLLADLQPIIEKLNILYSSNRVNYNAAKWDLEGMQTKKQSLLSEIPLIERDIAEKKKAAEAILAKARVQADKIIEVAQARNVEAMNNLKQVKDFVTEVEKGRYKELSAKVA